MKNIRRPLWVVLILVLLTGCRTQPVIVNDFMLDTVVAVTVYSSRDKSAAGEALELCREYEGMFSRTDKNSDVYRLNHAGGEAVAAPPELREVLEIAIRYSELTDGKYDVTICPVTDLWDFNAAEPSLPEPAEIQNALERVGFDSIVFEGDDKVRLKNGAQIDLGSIAKGYIADRMADYLREKGVKSAIINLGGNIITVGRKPDGKPFRIGVQKPFEQRDEIVGTVEIDSLSVVSSGVYERSFTLDGRLYHHLLDPDTGYPADTGLNGVTIISERSVDGDALSTCIFLLGPEEGLSLAESLPGIEAALIARDGSVSFTSGFGSELVYIPE